MQITPAGQPGALNADLTEGAQFTEGALFGNEVQNLRNLGYLQQTILKYGLVIEAGIDTILKARNKEAFCEAVTRTQTGSEELQLIIKHAESLGALKGLPADNQRVLAASERIRNVLGFYSEYSVYTERDTLALRHELADCKYELAVALPRAKNQEIDNLLRSGRAEFNPMQMLEHVQTGLTSLRQNLNDLYREKYEPKRFELQTSELGRQLKTSKDMLALAEVLEERLFAPLLKARMGLEKLSATLEFAGSTEVAAGDVVNLKAQARRLERNLGLLAEKITGPAPRNAA